MIRTRATTFSDFEEYQSQIQGLRLSLFFIRPGQFKARLTRIELPHLLLVRAEESLSRLAHISVPPECAAFVFSTRLQSGQTWDGVPLGSRNFAFLGPSDRLYQWTTGASNIGLISLRTKYLAAQFRAFAGERFILPPAGATLRASQSAVARLRQLHRKAFQRDERKPGVVSQKVLIALETDLLPALVNCLNADALEDEHGVRLRHKAIIDRFEDILVAHSDRPQRTANVCAAIGVSERTLRTCSAKILGVSAGQYMHVRRLHLARAELRGCDPPNPSVANVARRYGFTELGRFAVEYRTIFGERPSTTLRRARSQGGYDRVAGWNRRSASLCRSRSCSAPVR
jgi:AraC-like DNA-binding protein